ESIPSEAFAGSAKVAAGAGLRSPAPALDPDIVTRISTIDAGRIGASIQTLVNFGTRNTCSNNTGTSPGIGAARDWLKAQFSALPGVQVALVSFATTACGGTRTVQDVIA